MKKIIASAAAVLLSCTFISSVSFADSPLSADVNVTISDKDGNLAVIKEKITVTDIDDDGALTVNDALYTVHEEKYEGGAAAGYGSASGQYGLSVTKLWGTENGGSYGYYVNNAASMGLADPVRDGDDITAFVYTDLETWSDTYSWFETEVSEAKQYDTVTLSLKAAGFDENWAPVTNNVEGAVISINGKPTEYKTDSSGNVTIVLENEGRNVISASSDSIVLVPPVAVINAAASEKTTTVTEETASAETTTAVSATESSAASASSSATSAVSVASAPKTGDKGIGIAMAFLAVSAASAFAAGRRNEK